MLARARKIQHAIVGRLPYSRARGCRALARGGGEEWVRRTELMAARMDAAAGILLLCSAASALAALALMSQWLAAGAGLIMALALFSMAATMWLDKQSSAVQDQAFLFRESGDEDLLG